LRRSEDIVIALDGHGRRLFTSSAVESILGHSAEELNGVSAFELVHPEDLSAVQRAFARSLGTPGARERVEFRSRRKDGSYAHLEAIGVNYLHDPEVNALLIATRDVTDRTRYDALTGLVSRVPLLQHVKEASALLGRGKTFALLAVGIDRLPEYAASLGAEYSKRLICAVARRFELAATTEEMVAHLGGGTFALLAPGVCDADGALSVARRMQHALVQPLSFDADTLAVSASSGIAVAASGIEPEQLVHDAEVALARALQRGPRSTVVFDPEVRKSAQDRLSTETELRRALERDELVAYYQPIVGEQRRVCGFEALVRWRKPDGRLVPPGVFIPIAEKAGLICAVDLVMMRAACRQIAEWRKQSPDAWVSVNLSGEHFRDRRIVGSVLSILEEIQVPASALKLELTETALVENAETAAQVMRELQARGVRFGLDDFGTGYSSLGYLQRFRFDTLKIDRSFIRSLDSGEGNPELVSAMLTLARALRMEVVAEGVETRSQLAKLEALGCDFIQGYVYSPPVTAAAAGVMLRSVPLPFAVAA
jgi:PAS domain S-box-containing protein/diguanylate cyclase (GGDEF)-like protein